MTTVLISPSVLRWSRNRMAFMAALFFLLALCWATASGWWYVSSLRYCRSTARCRKSAGCGRRNLFALFLIARLCGLAALRPRRRRGGSRADDSPGTDRGRFHGGGVRRVHGGRIVRRVPDLLQQLVQRGRLSAAADWPTTCLVELVLMRVS